MPDPAIAALATDPTAKVLVFVDGQNLYKTCRSLFGHPLCHPHLLAQHLAGPRTRVDCRFYTGRPNPNTDPAGARNLDRRLAIMRREGVTVVTRPLRYHLGLGSSWPAPAGTRPGGRPAASAPYAMDATTGKRHRSRHWPGRRGVPAHPGLRRRHHREPGPRPLRDPASSPKPRPLIARPVRLEAAVPVPDGQKQPKILPRFSYTHQITRQVFERIRDDTDYTVTDAQWTPPTVPKTLPP